MTPNKEPINLNGWILTDYDVFHCENYSVITGHCNDYTIIDPVGNITRGDALHPLYTAVNIVNNLILNNS